MEELEDPTEKLKESIEEEVEEKNEAKERWTMNVALSTSIIAVLAAIAGLIGNHHANEAMLDQIKASDKWSYFQAKGIKLAIEVNTSQVISAINKQAAPDNKDKIEKYEKEKKDIKEDAEGSEKNSEEHMSRHIIISRSVTIFQIAIAISAISILTRKKLMWYVSMLLALAGCVFLVQGMI